MNRKLTIACVELIVGLVGMLVLGWLLVACVLPSTPAQPVDPGPRVTRMLVPVHDAAGNLPTNLVSTLTPWDGMPTIEGTNEADGVLFVTASTGGSSACFEAQGLAKTCVDLTIEATEPSVTMKPAHVDPSTFSLNQLAAIRGAMWTARLDVPYGPRPNQPSNILAMVFYDLYDAPTRARMLHHYHDELGYTTSVAGPVTGNDCYHSLYPCHQGLPTQGQWDAYLDSLQEIWDAGVEPCYFAHPDGWTLPENATDMDRLDALYRQPRAQALLRCVVYPGWEPSGDKYGWNNAQYVAWVKRGSEVFPDALRVLHTVSDLDAPTGGNDSNELGPNGNAVSWQRVAPYIHVWFNQVGGYVEEGQPQPSSHFLSEFQKLWADLHHKFTTGASDWPTTSAWGNAPLRVCYAEGAAFSDFWGDFPESVAMDLGDLAMQSGADCYLDGGRLAVPVR